MVELQFDCFCHLYVFGHQVFEEFEEAGILFQPTYKYAPGMTVFETRAGKKLRVPAWCDRVLWRASDVMSGAVSLHKYVSIQHMCASDHKPVAAAFSVDCVKIDPQRELEVFEEEMENQDRCLNDSIPRLHISTTALEFQHHGNSTGSSGSGLESADRTQTLYITNVGKVDAIWRILPRHSNEITSTADIQLQAQTKTAVQYCSWLELDVDSGVLCTNEVRRISCCMLVPRC